MDKNRINIGDLVDVYFGSANALFLAEVLYMPQNTGDSWILKTTVKVSSTDYSGEVITKDKEFIHYVQQFERMDKL